jgi:hypothetical protein
VPEAEGVGLVHEADVELVEAQEPRRQLVLAGLLELQDELGRRIEVPLDRRLRR